MVGTGAIDGGVGTDLLDGGAGTDKIELAVHAFAGLSGYGVGTLGSGELAFGSAATTADQHLIYNGTSGALYYDADGAGGAAQVHIALLMGHPALQASDIVVI